MDSKVFINFYDVFEVDPGAKPEVIERRFRRLARRYHPDNMATGDRARFDAIVEAHETLKDLGRRAKYHEKNPHNLPPLVTSWDEESGGSDSSEDDNAGGRDDYIDESGIGRDTAIQNNILALLYQRRRRNIREPGIGNAELEALTGCPHDHLEFHIWYLKAKGWIYTGEDGRLAITVDGVDRAAVIYGDGVNRLITDQS